jgi:hypothetical protein
LNRLGLLGGFLLIRRIVAASAAVAIASSASVAQARPIPLAAPDYSARAPIDPDVLENPRCEFRAVPGLTMTQRRLPVHSSAVFKAPNREGGGKDTYFSLAVSESDKVTSWRGILAQDPRFSASDPAFARNHIERAAITLDGKPFAVPMTVMHGKGFGEPWSTSVTIAPEYYADQDQWFALLEQGSLASVYLYDGNNKRYGPWSFDVSAFRNIPAAIKGSQFRC